MIKKTVLFALLLYLLAIGHLMAETRRKGFVFFPVTEPSFKANFVVSRLFPSIYPTPRGQRDPKQDGSFNGSGVEISLDCPWFQLGSNPLRQQISYVSYKQDYTHDSGEEEKFAIDSLEFNPQYVISGRVFGFGFGPGFGFLRARSEREKYPRIYFTLQYGASFVVKLGWIHLAVEFRRQKSQEGPGTHLDNDRRVFKAGIAF